MLGVITVYVTMLNSPLYCDTGDTNLVVGHVSTPWVAIPVEMYNYWDCGDMIRLSGVGWELYARAYDAGPLSDYYVEEHLPLPIIADIPVQFAPFEGLSAVGRVENMSKLERGLFP